MSLGYKPSQYAQCWYCKQIVGIYQIDWHHKRYHPLKYNQLNLIDMFSNYTDIE